MKSQKSFYTLANLIVKSVYILLLGQGHENSRFVNGNCTENDPNHIVE